jgi:hypothetical protein
MKRCIFHTRTLTFIGAALLLLGLANKGHAVPINPSTIPVTHTPSVPLPSPQAPPVTKPITTSQPILSNPSVTPPVPTHTQSAALLAALARIKNPVIPPPPSSTQKLTPVTPNAMSVPDGGNAAMMLGAAVCGLVGLKRKLHF